MTEPDLESSLPRYRTLTLCVRAALLGARHPLVQHMAERNRSIDEARALHRALQDLHA